MSELAGPSHVTAVTGMECCEFTYEWTIKNFRQSYEKIIESPGFSSHYGDFDDKWILRIYIDSMSNERGGIHILAGLQLQSFNNTSQLQTKCKIIINDKYEITKEHDFSEFPEEMNCNKLIPRSGLLDPLSGYLRNDLKIYCTITMFKKLTNSSDAISVFYVRQQLIVDLKKLLLNEKLSDVILRVGQKSFHAIKGILAVRSPVFSAMFDHEEFKENKRNEVVIEDIDEDVFEEFLHYIYTGESPTVDKMPMELLAVAEKYQVDRLKNICENIICKMINVDNVASKFVFSDRYNLEKLNQKCLEFMKKNLRDVMSNKTFQVYKKKYPEIFVGVLEELLLSANSVNYN